MTRPVGATGIAAKYLRECLDVLSVDPPALRWWARPRSHFGRGKAGDQAHIAWNRNFAGQDIRPEAGGQLRVSLTVNGAPRVKLGDGEAEGRPWPRG